MGTEPRYNRVLLKLSGEALCASGGSGVDPAAAGRVADELAPVAAMGARVAIVVGGGNFIRGARLAGAKDAAIARATADHMGMLATVINALALRDVLVARGLPARAMSAIGPGGICEAFDRHRALRHLEAGQILLLGGGTGNPFFTTDTCAALRAVELGADVLLKATQVDGVYDRDPVACPGARRYSELTYGQVLADRLGVMDLAAVSMCMENGIPVVVFRLADPGSLARAVRGETVGTRIHG